MKLSEAMRLGAMALPPTRGCAVFDYRGADACGACAIGAVAFAIGVTDSTAAFACAMDESGPLVEAFPLLAQIAIPPCEHAYEGTVAHWLTTLFEVREWTREAIADWVETLEVQPAVAAVDPVGVSVANGKSPQAVHAREESLI